MSQLTFRTGSFVSTTPGSGDAQTINKPTGTAEGDIIVFVYYWESDTNVITLPSGFASVEQTNPGSFKLGVCWKRAAGSEPSNYTFTPGTNSQWRSLVGAAYQNGTGLGALLDVSAGDEGDAESITLQLSPSVTTRGVDRLLLWSYGNFSGTDGDLTPIGAVTTARGWSGGTALGDVAIASASATGTTRPDGGTIGSETWAGLHVALISDTQSPISVPVGSAGFTGSAPSLSLFAPASVPAKIRFSKA